MKTIYNWQAVATDTDSMEIQIGQSGICIATIESNHYVTAGGPMETRPAVETARLLAAAPDLLAACKMLCGELSDAVKYATENDPGGNHNAGIWQTAIKEARAAISKAERGEG